MMKVHNLIAIADAANMKLTMTKDEDVSGAIDIEFEVNQFRMPFDLEVETSVLSASEQAYAVLLKGPGDFRLAIAYSSKSDALVAYVLDASIAGFGEAKCKGSKESSVMQAIRTWKRDAVRTYTKKRMGPKWKEVNLELCQSGTTETGIS